MNLLRVIGITAVCLVWCLPQAKAAPDTLQIVRLLERSVQLIAKKKPDSAETLIKQACVIAKQGNYKRLWQKGLQELSRVQFAQLNYQGALSSSQLQLKVASDLDDKEGIANAYNNISIQYHALGDLRQASSNLISALKIAEQLPHFKNLQKFYSNLASVYIDLNDAKNSLYYAKKGYVLARKQNNSLQITKSLVNLAASEVMNRQYAAARKHLFEMQGLATSINDTSLILHALLNLGDIAIRQERYPEALEQYRATNRILQLAPDTDYEMYAWSGLANSYFLLQQYGPARTWFERLRPIAEAYMPKSDLVELYEIGANIYAQTGNYREAFAMEKNYAVLKDSILNADTRKTVHELEVKYQLSQKEKTLAQQKLALKNSREEIQQKNRYMFMAGVLLVLFMFLMLLIYLLYRNKAQFMQLSLLKAQIHPHFLFNTLNNLYALSLAKADQTPQVVLGLSEILRYILYECNASRTSLQQEIAVIERYLSLERMRYDDRLEINFNVRGDHGQRSMVPLLLLPLVENAFKHGIGEQLDDGWINISSEVNGMDYVFKISNSKPPAVARRPSSIYGRIGLANIRRRLQLLYPRQHKLTITDEGEMFVAVLKIRLTQISEP